MRNSRKLFAALLALAILFLYLPAGFAASVSSAITRARVTEISQTNALLASSVTWNGAKPSEVGFYLGKSGAAMTRVAYDTVLPNSTYIKFWYNLHTECGMQLAPNTTYNCRPYVVQADKCIRGDIISFQTAAISAGFTSIQASNISNTAARVSCYLTYQSSTKPSKVGMYLKYGSTRKLVGADTDLPTAKTFKMWYDLTGLAANTQYTLQPFAVFDGVTFSGPANVSFKTQATAAQPTVSKTRAQALTWAKIQVGKQLGSGQCVALITAYYAYLGVNPPAGNAADYATNSYLPGLTPIKGAQPQPGDILVYTGGPNNWGHVAIYESDYQTYHQNFNYHPYVEKLGNYFSGFSTPYWGVVRPAFK